MRGFNVNNGLVIKLLLLAVLMAFQAYSLSRDVYQTSEDFISHAFEGTVPKAQTLWLKGDTVTVKIPSGFYQTDGELMEWQPIQFI